MKLWISVTYGAASIIISVDVPCTKGLLRAVHVSRTSGRQITGRRWSMGLLSPGIGAELLNEAVVKHVNETDGETTAVC